MEQDQPDAQAEVAVRVLRPGGGRSGNRHGRDESETDEDLLDLVRVVPRPHEDTEHENKGERRREIRGDLAQEQHRSLEQVPEAFRAHAQPGVEQQRPEHECWQGEMDASLRGRVCAGARVANPDAEPWQYGGDRVGPPYRPDEAATDRLDD